jgi:hypothetical protein
LCRISARIRASKGELIEHQVELALCSLRLPDASMR